MTDIMTVKELAKILEKYPNKDEQVMLQTPRGSFYCVYEVAPATEVTKMDMVSVESEDEYEDYDGDVLVEDVCKIVLEDWDFEFREGDR